MSREPTFDELVGAEPVGAERERLRRVHELLLAAGPPPELPPQLASVPTFAVVRLRERRMLKRRVLLVVAAALAVAVAFAAGYAVANHGGGGTRAVTTATLRGTHVAPQARATLELLPTRQGNRPALLSVVGLPTLPPHAYYGLYLVRPGVSRVSCGTFRESSSSPAFTVTLNVPYALAGGDSWVVTRTSANGQAGPAVLRSSRSGS